LAYAVPPRRLSRQHELSANQVRSPELGRMCVNRNLSARDEIRFAGAGPRGRDG
jgi:hypothetical protein